jgi:hypothetical protein
MNITSVLSVKAARKVHKTVKGMVNQLDDVHFQVVENRLEYHEDDDIYIQCISSDTDEDKQELVSSSTSEDRIFANHYQLYKQNVTSTTQPNRFIYCIVPPNTNESVKTVCVVSLSQSRMQLEPGMSSDYEYEASLCYITIPLRDNNTHIEQSSYIKDKILQTVTNWDEFRECVKVDLFSTGRLWEMPIQFPDHNTMYLSMHEPITRPSVLNVVLQKYSGISVSKKLCTNFILD